MDSRRRWSEFLNHDTSGARSASPEMTAKKKRAGRQWGRPPGSGRRQTAMTADVVTRVDPVPSGSRSCYSLVLATLVDSALSNASLHSGLSFDLLAFMQAVI